MTMKRQILISTFFILLSLCLFVISIYIALSAMNHSFITDVNISYDAPPIILRFVNNEGSNVNANNVSVVYNEDESEFRIDGIVPETSSGETSNLDDLTNSSGAEFYWFSDNSNVIDNANNTVWEEQERFYVSTKEDPLWYEVPQTQIELYSTFLTPNCTDGTQSTIGSNTDIIISHQVTSIPDDAFNGIGNITSIVIPSSVTTIGSEAFVGALSSTARAPEPGASAVYIQNELERIILPNSILSIEGYAFANCINLSSVYIEDVSSFMQIDFGSSGSNVLNHSTTSDPAYYIVNSTFVDTNLYVHNILLTDLIIDSNVTYISDYVFSDYENLTSITIPDSVVNIGYSAFSHCSNLTNVTIGNNSNLTSIESFAFYYCKSLDSITIPERVTSIGNSAFSSCSSLTNVTILSSVVSMDAGVFSGCDNLNYTTYSNAKYLGNSSNPYLYLWECTADTITSCTINTNCKNIGRSAFSGCTGLTNVNFGTNSNLIKIGSFAFSSCESLTSITIPDSVVDIGSYAFSGCSSISSITIPNSVLNIGSYAFRNCSGLTRITISESVNSIGSSAFSDCSGLAYITVKEGNSVYHSSNNCLIETLTKTLIAGCKNSVIPSDGSVVSIGDSAFYGCSGLRNITIPNSVVSIGNHAFYNCTGLTSVTIPNSVVSIGDNVFSGCDNLNYTTYSNAKYLGNSSNRYLYLWESTADTIRSCTINSNCKFIASNAFYGCTELMSITFPEGVVSIGEYAFRSCESLTRITIPESLTSIGEWAFYYCTGLVSIIIPEGVTSIDSYAFYYCNDLTIYCEAVSQPSGWDSNWNSDDRPVYWGGEWGYDGDGNPVVN